MPGAVGTAEVSSFRSWGSPGNGGVVVRDAETWGFSSSSAATLEQVTVPLQASVLPLHCASGDTEAQRRVGLAQTCTHKQPIKESEVESQARTPRSQARALSSTVEMRKLRLRRLVICLRVWLTASELSELRLGLRSPDSGPALLPASPRQLPSSLLGLFLERPDPE